MRSDPGPTKTEQDGAIGTENGTPTCNVY